MIRTPEAERAIEVLVDTATLSNPDRDWRPWAEAVIDGVVTAEQRELGVGRMNHEPGAWPDCSPLLCGHPARQA